jgi:hypothetical protein
MWDYIFTFIAVFVLDLVYTHYLKHVNNNHVLGASFWSVGCYLLASVAVINYTNNHLLLIPAAFGAFFGTFVGMKIRYKKQ